MSAMKRIAVVTAVGLAACGGGSDESSERKSAYDLAKAPVEETVTVTSSAFADGAEIPTTFSCDGDDVSPPLAWTGVPADAAQLAMVMDDPYDGGSYVHWIVFGMAPSDTDMAEGQVPDDALQAENSAGDATYMGPCPPPEDDAHDYRFTVYALDEKLDAKDGAGATEVLDAIKGAAVAKGTLDGSYLRQ
jgi:Raf kinase inhibitor-like YbhB/YbcL family protein